MADLCDAAAAIAAGRQLVNFEERIHLVDGIPVALLDQSQSICVLESALALAAARAPAPPRRKGTARHQELSSFGDHVKRFASGESVIWADVDAVTLTAVFDYHPAGEDESDAAWCQHRAVYVCPKSEAWQRWRKQSDVWMKQEDFAAFLEDNLEDLTSGKEAESSPAPIAVLEMARGLQLNTKGRFSRKMDPRSGDYSIICQQETESCSTEIPRAFLVALPVFVGGELYRIEARVRCRIQDGGPQLSYVLHRAVEVEHDAFGDVRSKAAEGTGLPVFAGTPEG